MKDAVARLEETIRDLLAQRAETSTICPSDDARAIGGETWRDLMDDAREAARRMADAGEVEITQKGEVVDLAAARGPIRIRRRADRSDHRSSGYPSQGGGAPSGGARTVEDGRSS